MTACQKKSTLLLWADYCLLKMHLANLTLICIKRSCLVARTGIDWVSLPFPALYSPNYA